MKTKIGQTEGDFAIVLFSLALPVFFTVSSEIKNLYSGAIWNLLICVVINMILAYYLSRFFEIHGINTIYKVTEIYYGKQTSIIISVLINIMIFIYVLFVFQSGCSKIFNINAISPDYQIIKLFLITVVGVFAIKGIEAITRLSYLLFFVMLFILSVLILITSNGFKLDNIYPVMGKNIKSTLLPSRFLCLNFGLILYLLTADCYNNSKKLVFSVKRTCFIINMITLIIVIWYCFSVPDAIAQKFESGIEAVFSSSVSGQIFRRFEIFMISLYIIIQSVCAGLGIFVISKSFADVFEIKDYKPFSLIISVLLFNLTDCKLNAEPISYLCSGFFVFVIFLVFIINIKKRFIKQME